VRAARLQRRAPELERGRHARKGAFIGWECGCPARKGRLGARACRPQRCVHRLGVGA